MKITIEFYDEVISVKTGKITRKKKTLELDKVYEIHDADNNIVVYQHEGPGLTISKLNFISMEMKNDPDQEKHLQAIKNSFALEVDKKYRAGQAEHGGNLFDMNEIALVENAMQECIDSYVYLHTLREKLIDIRDELEKLKDAITPDKSST